MINIIFNLFRLIKLKLLIKCIIIFKHDTHSFKPESELVYITGRYVMLYQKYRGFIFELFVLLYFFGLPLKLKTGHFLLHSPDSRGITYLGRSTWISNPA